MKRFVALICFVLLAAFAFAEGEKVHTRPFAFGVEKQPWWRARMNNEEFRWVDHHGRTNTAVRALLKVEEENPDARVSNQGVYGFVRPDFTFVSYTVTHGATKEGTYEYNIDNVAPGTYDLINGKWYDDMTIEEKHAKWAVYTNKCIQAVLADIAERSAPAKFNVERSPEEYKEFLLGGRDESTLTPDEMREIRAEYNLYRLEWIRVNDPENYRPKLTPKFNENLSEQQKKARSERFERYRTLRAKRLQQSKQK